MKTIKQYRVIFTAMENVNGNIVDVGHSTKWFELESECNKWMSKDNAIIVTRDFLDETREEFLRRSYHGTFTGIFFTLIMR